MRELAFPWKMAERDPSHLRSQIHAEDFSCPLSLPSQPPDIRNWFSSYEYESPDSADLPHDLGSFRLPEDCDSETQDPLESPAVKRDDHILTEGKCVGGDNGNTECYPIVNGDAFRDQEEFSKSPVARLKRKRNLPQVVEERCTMKDAAQEDDSGLATNSNNDNDKSKNDASTDGFISTKKSRTSISMNQENNGTSQHLIRERLQEKNGILSGREESQVGRASPLADRTNVQVEQGIPGKWQCPRKRKPFVGTPMKQLRLEQWVRRVN